MLLGIGLSKEAVATLNSDVAVLQIVKASYSTFVADTYFPGILTKTFKGIETFYLRYTRAHMCRIILVLNYVQHAH